MPPPDAIDAWLASRGIAPFPFQRETWDHIAAGRVGAAARDDRRRQDLRRVARRAATRTRRAVARRPPPVRKLRILWITPMRALAADTTRALADATAGVGLDWDVEMRTGDTDAATRARQSKHLPEALVTTPESLTLLLARADARDALRRVSTIVVDEWHELMGNKRGVQTQLAIARLWRWNPALIAWGLSATLGNLDDRARSAARPRRARQAAAAA